MAGRDEASTPTPPASQMKQTSCPCSGAGSGRGSGAGRGAGACSASEARAQSLRSGRLLPVDDGLSLGACEAHDPQRVARDRRGVGRAGHLVGLRARVKVRVRMRLRARV